MQDRLWGYRELAEYTGYAVGTLRNKYSRGDRMTPMVDQVDGHPRWLPSEVMKYYAQRSHANRPRRKRRGSGSQAENQMPVVGNSGVVIPGSGHE